MGKSSKPLTIVVTDPTMMSWPEIEQRVAQGFTIVTMETYIKSWGMPEGPLKVDVFMGPDCWRMEARTQKYFETAVTESRKLRYPK